MFLSLNCHSWSVLVLFSDILEKAAKKHGQKAMGKTGGQWGGGEGIQKTNIFLSHYITLLNIKMDPKSDDMWNEVRARMWLFNDLDFSVGQLKEKMRGLKAYFTTVVIGR